MRVELIRRAAAVLRTKEYIATMPPGVALALADLLEEHADGWDAGPYSVSSDDFALDVALAVLGSGDQ